MHKLSPAQEQARQINRDTVLRAGAGAGKTTTLLRALEDDLYEISPSQLAVVTFTRAAASSLRSRLEEELYRSQREVPGLELLWLGTIDSLAARILRERALFAGQNPEVRPGSDGEMRRLAEQALQETEWEVQTLDQWIDPQRDLLDMLLRFDEECTARGVEPRALLRPEPDQQQFLLLLQELLEENLTDKQSALVTEDMNLVAQGKLIPKRGWNIRKNSEKIDLAKAEREAYRQSFIDQMTFPIKEEFLELFHSWREKRRELSTAEGIWSFSDIIRLAEEGEEKPFLKKMYLDEAQDTSPAQFRFLRSLLLGPLVCVGDPNQSIYGFRGADLDNFHQQTAHMDEIKLEDNYRSAPEIISTVESICRPLLGDSLLEMKHSGPLQKGFVQSIELRGEKVARPREEAEALIPCLQEELRHYQPEEITILFRSNHDLDTFYEVLRSAGLPVAALRSGGLLLQDECLDILAYFHLLLSPEDEGHLLRVLSSPFAGLSAENLLDYSGDLQNASNHLQPILDKAKTMLGKYSLSQIGRFLVEAHQLDISLDLLDSTGARMENIDTLLRLLGQLEREEDGYLYEKLLERFQDVLLETKPSLQGVEAIVLQTIHQAKGEEYSCVVVPRLGRQLPSKTGRKFFISTEDEVGIALPGALRDSVARRGEEDYVCADREEEKRLLYVALTRAKEKLILIASGKENKPLAGLLPALPNPSAPSLATAKRKTDKHEEDITFPTLAVELPPIMPRDISWSELMLWKRCGLRRRLEGEIGMQGKREGAGGSGSRQRGIRVHNAIELLLQGKPLPDLDTEESEMVDYARTKIEEGAEAEHSFVLALGPSRLRGRIDYISFGAQWIVRDWKSGEEEWEEDYSLQRKIYALYALRSGAVSVQAETVLLRNQKIYTDLWQAGDVHSLEKEIQETVAKVFAQEPAATAKKQQPFCAGCPGLVAVCHLSMEADEVN